MIEIKLELGGDEMQKLWELVETRKKNVVLPRKKVVGLLLDNGRMLNVLATSSIATVLEPPHEDA